MSPAAWNDVPARPIMKVLDGVLPTCSLADPPRGRMISSGCVADARWTGQDGAVHRRNVDGSRCQQVAYHRRRRSADREVAALVADNDLRRHPERPGPRDDRQCC
jgi:hypothetical protein